MLEKMYTKKEVQNLLSISYYKLRKLNTAGLLVPAYKYGYQELYKEEDIENFLKDKRVNPQMANA